MEEIKKDSDVVVNSTGKVPKIYSCDYINTIKKVVTVQIGLYPVANDLIRQGWVLLRITGSYYVFGHHSEAVTIPQLGVK